MTNDEDYAIIVGLQHYPGLDNAANGQPPLAGPENDAKAFYNWVLDPNGGAVPQNHIELVLSSNYGGPFPTIFDTRPAFNDIARNFMILRAISEDNISKGKGMRIGRRLYIFMSGHGITPNTLDEDNEKEAALLLANVDSTTVVASQYQLRGANTASWFCKNDCFDEVFLFMDCCRHSRIVPGINTFLPRQGSATKAKKCYAFATQWSLAAREKPMPDEGNKVRGIFTKTLVKGLEGAAADPDPNDAALGVITAESLRSYLYQNMRNFVDPQFINEPDVQQPQVDCWPNNNNGKDIIIKSVPLKRFPFTITIPAGMAGDLRIFGGIPIREKLRKLIPAAAASSSFQFDLPRGQYLATLDTNGNTIEKDIKISGIEEVTGAFQNIIAF